MGLCQKQRGLGDGDGRLFAIEVVKKLRLSVIMTRQMTKQKIPWLVGRMRALLDERCETPVT